jgi:hypothetical protein
MDQTQALEPDENGEVPCPVCHDYHGKPESVEGHITGKSDDDHRGQIGKDYRCVQDGTRTLWTEPNPELSGTVPVLDEEYTIPESDGEKPDNVTQPENGSEDQDDENGYVGALVVGLAILVLWLARRTGTEDQVREVTVL